MVTMNTGIRTDQAFLTYLEDWVENLPAASLESVFPDPQRSALFSTDLINGFCTIGPLASPRVNNIVPAAVQLMQRVWDAGVRNIVLGQDAHLPDAKEFAAWPPHCVRDTAEAETVTEIRRLPFADQIRIIPKNSISTGLWTGLTEWLLGHPEVDNYVVIGDCTDLCVYQLAMHLRLDANARHLDRRVIVPENAVQTYDRTIQAAEEQGGFPHPGDMMHKVFLYHMALNGIEIVGSIE